MQKLLYLIMMLLFLSFNISSQTKTVVIDQVNSSQIQIGTLQKWSGTQWSNFFFPGTSFSFQIGSTQTILGDQNIYSNEKYNNWNESTNNVVNFQSFQINAFTDDLTSHFEETHTGIIIQNSLEGTDATGGLIRFRDPWFVDYEDGSYNNQKRNRGMSAHPHYRTSPFSPDASTHYNHGSKYNGVFLDMDHNIPGNTYYTVMNYEDQMISVHGESRKFIFQNWTSTYNGNNPTAEFEDSTSLETPVTFRDGSAVVKANLKGEYVSNQEEGYGSPSQRTYVSGYTGDELIQILVYESDSCVWMETSNGVHNHLNIISKIKSGAKNPSVCFDEYHYRAYIVYEFVENNKLYLGYTTILYDHSSLSHEQVEICDTAGYFGNAKPVISMGANKQVILFKPALESSLQYRIKQWLNGNWVWRGAAVDVPYTSSNTTAWAIASNLDEEHSIALQQGITTIEYLHCDPKNSGEVRFCSYRNLSSGSGNNYNRYPSISCYKTDNNTFEVMVSWTGSKTPYIEKSNSKNSGAVATRKAAVARVGYGAYASNWPQVWNSFGDDVDFTNNNSFTNSTSPYSHGTILAYSHNNGQFSKYVKRAENGSYSTIYSLDHSGIMPLVTNGYNFAEMRALVFDNSTSAPYLFRECGNDFSTRQVGKNSSADNISISYGRTGSLVKDDIEFIFNVGDVFVDNNNVEFLSISDTMSINSYTDFSGVLRTENFPLGNESELIFSNYYYVTNDSNAAQILGEDFCITSSCRLINASTNEIVGSFDPVTYTSENTSMHNHVGYSIDCAGLTPGEYYLSLNITCSDSMNCFIGNIQRDDISIKKSALTERMFTGEKIPASFELNQNYPNPFNPFTKISYYLPEDCKVTIKVYDILGAEAATLIDDYKNSGYHNTRFDGSRLASGVYFYRMIVNKPGQSKTIFSETKKLVLLK